MLHSSKAALRITTERHARSNRPRRFALVRLLFQSQLPNFEITFHRIPKLIGNHFTVIAIFHFVHACSQ